jgi:hypothetical protein
LRDSSPKDDKTSKLPAAPLVKERLAALRIEESSEESSEASSEASSDSSNSSNSSSDDSTQELSVPERIAILIKAREARLALKKSCLRQSTPNDDALLKKTVRFSCIKVQTEARRAKFVSFNKEVQVIPTLETLTVDDKIAELLESLPTRSVPATIPKSCLKEPGSQTLQPLKRVQWTDEAEKLAALLEECSSSPSPEKLRSCLKTKSSTLSPKKRVNFANASTCSTRCEVLMFRYEDPISATIRGSIKVALAPELVSPPSTFMLRHF